MEEIENLKLDNTTQQENNKTDDVQLEVINLHGRWTEYPHTLSKQKESSETIKRLNLINSNDDNYVYFVSQHKGYQVLLRANRKDYKEAVNSTTQEE